jgi:phosphatidylserine/phosphatidylglycerophosphate/cardiolipin synthase-like enzyme
MSGLFKKKNTIQSEILSDLRQAKKSIQVAVSWLTDTVLITELIEKRKQGVEVKILLSANELNIIRFELFKKIQELGGSVQKCGNEETTQGGFMHYKFYIIDDYLAKSGSYNWSVNATSNAEALDQVAVGKKIAEFNELYPVSVDFFAEIDNPEQKRAELEDIRREHNKETLTPEMLKAYRDTQTYKKEYAETQRVQEEQTRRIKELEIQLARERGEREQLAKIEDDRKLQEQQAAAQRARALEIQLAKEKAERERLTKIEADIKAKEQAAQYRPKEEVKETTLPPTSYA